MSRRDRAAIVAGLVPVSEEDADARVHERARLIAETETLLRMLTLPEIREIHGRCHTLHTADTKDRHL